MIIFKHNQLKNYFRKAVKEILDVSLGDFPLEYPPKVEMGDLAMSFPFSLAKELRKAPRQIAQDLVEKITPPPGVARMEAAGAGYINLFFDRAAVVQYLSGNDAASSYSDQNHVTVEHSSINPNKAAHIGHLRNSCLGDSLARMLRFLGRPVTVQNYIDDTGVQVADVVVGFKYIRNFTVDEIREIPEPFDYYCWDLYSSVSKFYEEDESRKELKKKALHSMEAGEGEEAELGDVIARRIVECHLRTMDRLNIEYDLLAWEGDILKGHFWTKAFELLKETKAVYFAEEGKNKGCWVMDLSKSKAFEDMEDPDKIIVRSDGTVTYVGKDIAYHLWKFGVLGKDFYYCTHRQNPSGSTLWSTTSAAGHSQNYNNIPGKSIYNVIDVGQEYTQKVVAESILSISGEDVAKGFNHFSYEKVALTPASAQELGVELAPGEEKKQHIAMSGRRGLGVKGDDMVDMLIEKATKEVQARNPEFSKEEVDSTSEKIAIGALRYYMVKFARKQILGFDFDTALSFEGESGPYISYALVRANNIFNKLVEEDGLNEADIPGMLTSVDWSAISQGDSADPTWELISLIARTPQVVADAVENLELSVFAKFVYSMAQKFNAWYHKYPILREEDINLKNSRIVILDLFRKSFEKSLELIGIQVPERM